MINQIQLSCFLVIKEIIFLACCTKLFEICWMTGNGTLRRAWANTRVDRRALFGPPSCPDVVIKPYIPSLPPVTSSELTLQRLAGFDAHMTLIPPKASRRFCVQRTCLGYLLPTHATGSRNWRTSNRSSLHALVSSRTQVPPRGCNNLLWNRHLRIECKVGILIWSKRSHGFTGWSLLNHKKLISGVRHILYNIFSEHIIDVQ